MIARARHRQKRYALISVLVIVSAFLTLHNIELFTSVGANNGLWFDEGYNLEVPKNLSRLGVYALGDAYGNVDLFSDTITTGPTVLLPIAILFEYFGIGLLPGRLVMSMYLVLSTIVFYLLSDWLYGSKVAFLASAFFLSGAIADPLARIAYPFEPIAHSRYVIGEVPGFFFIVLGTLFWAWSFDGHEPGKRHLLLVLAGLSWGLAIQTKVMYALVLVALVLWGVAGRQSVMSIALPLASALVPAAIWLGYQFTVIGPSVLDRVFFLGWPSFSSGQAGLVNNVQTILARIWNLSGMGLLVFGIPSLLLGVVSVTTESPGARRSVQGMLLMFVVVWICWWTLSALGRPRHFLPALFLTNIFFAKFLAFLGDDLGTPSMSTSRTRWREREFWNKYTRSFLILVTALLLLFNPMKRLFLNVIRDVEESPWQVVAFVESSKYGPTQIAASERELDFLLDRPLYDLIWKGDQLPDRLDLIVCGAQAKLHIVCPPVSKADRSRLVFQAGPYDVYEIEPLR